MPEVANVLRRYGHEYLDWVEPALLPSHRRAAIYGKPTVQGPEQELNYLGRDVHRIALTNSRILSIADGNVCFRYQDAQDQRWKSMTLPALEFIRRFLEHVLPEAGVTQRVLAAPEQGGRRPGP
jgi:hypothetical protein